MAETSALLRQWKILAALSSRAAHTTVRDLAREHAVSEKTICRDLAMLKRAGFPFEETLGDYGRKQLRLSPAKALPALSLNWEEAIALWLARRFMKPLAGTNFWTAVNRAYAKVRAVLGDEPLRYVERMASAFHLTGGDGGEKYAAKALVCDELTRAIEERRMTDLVYQSENATEPVSRTVYPYGWVVHHDSLYLVAHAPDHGQQRLYKLDRMESVKVDALQFQRSPDFSLSHFFAGSFGVFRGDGQAPIAVRIRFLPAVARAIGDKQFHPSQQLTRERDGSITAEFELTATQELKSWLLSWGANAVVLEPQALADEMRAEAESLVRLYTPKKSDAVDGTPSPLAGRVYGPESRVTGVRRHG
jgi:predicted DNA-binding transcriptional regulator YafY